MDLDYIINLVLTITFAKKVAVQSLNYLLMLCWICLTKGNTTVLINNNWLVIALTRDDNRHSTLTQNLTKSILNCEVCQSNKLGAPRQVALHQSVITLDHECLSNNRIEPLLYMRKFLIFS